MSINSLFQCKKSNCQHDQILINLNYTCFQKVTQWSWNIWRDLIDFFWKNIIFIVSFFWFRICPMKNIHYWSMKSTIDHALPDVVFRTGNVSSKELGRISDHCFFVLRISMLRKGFLIEYETLYLILISGGGARRCASKVFWFRPNSRSSFIDQMTCRRWLTCSQCVSILIWFDRNRYDIGSTFVNWKKIF